MVWATGEVPSEATAARSLVDRLPGVQLLRVPPNFDRQPADLAESVLCQVSIADYVDWPDMRRDFCTLSGIGL